MPILEDCRSASEITIKYQLWGKEGLLFKFPTDGREDSTGQSKGDKNILVAGYTRHRTEINLDFTSYVIWGSAVSQCNLGGELANTMAREFCGDTIYWVKQARDNKPKDGISLEYKSGSWGVLYNDGARETGRWTEIYKDTFDSKSWDLVLEEFAIKTAFTWRNIWHFNPDRERLPRDSNCNLTTTVNPSLRIEENSINLDEVTPIEEYFKTIAINEEGRERHVTSRTTVANSVIYVDEGLMPEEEIILAKKPDVEDIEVFVDTSGLVFYKNDVETGDREFIPIP